MSSILCKWFGIGCPKPDPKPPTSTPPAEKAVAVVVSSSSGPVAGAKVVLDGDSNVFPLTNSDGYTIDNHCPASLTASQLTVTKDGYVPYSEHVDLVAGEQTLRPTIKSAHKDPSTVSDSALRAFKGNFCGIRIDGLPYGPNNVLFTPAYFIYSEGDRQKCREAYKTRGYTHFPVSLFSGSVYHDFYPDPDVSRVNEFLQELWDDGLIPVCFDHGDDFSVNSGVDPKLVRVVVPQWEMNGPCNNDTALINKTILETKSRFPQALLYVHFTSGHAAGGEPESDWWVWAKSQGVRGLLYQDGNWNDPQAMWDRCVDFLIRFGSGYHGWPTDVDFVMFENCAYPAFWSGWTEAQTDDLQHFLKSKSPAVYSEGGITFTGDFAGFCNGNSN
jgi:hypothetical protein